MADELLECVLVTDDVAFQVPAGKAALKATGRDANGLCCKRSNNGDVVLP